MNERVWNSLRQSGIKSSRIDRLLSAFVQISYCLAYSVTMVTVRTTYKAASVEGFQGNCQDILKQDRTVSKQLG